MQYVLYNITIIIIIFVHSLGLYMVLYFQKIILLIKCSFITKIVIRNFVVLLR